MLVFDEVQCRGLGATGVSVKSDYFGVNLGHKD
ncbi:hypothetical protein LMED105_05532 [Limnobacter sp. MED105]|nr:hypothetical protein LMED105_05532 [Limnobacter sp. MED105]